MTLQISKPFSDDEIMMMDMLPPGTYKFKIIEGMAKTSSKGSPMIVIKLAIMHLNQEYLIDDFLLTNSKQMLFKLKHCLDSIGKMDLWEKCNFTARDFLGQSGYAIIGMSKGQQKDDGTFYPDKNNVQDYIKADQHDKIESKLEADKPFEDSDTIPF